MSKKEKRLFTTITVILILISPLITFIYLKSISKLKNNYSNYYKVDIYIDENNINKYQYLNSNTECNNVAGIVAVAGNEVVLDEVEAKNVNISIYEKSDVEKADNIISILTTLEGDNTP